MKRYILCSEDPASSQPFDLHKTGMSYYDNFLNEKDLKYMQDAKNLTGEIVYMTPSTYYSECAKNIFKGRVSSDDLIEQRMASRGQDGYEGRLVDQYAEEMRKGDIFPICVLNYADDGQEGLHRMLAAGKAFGKDTKFPVLVVKPYDMEKWEESKLYSEVRDYARYDLEDAVDKAVDDLSDWTGPIPENIENSLATAIEHNAKVAEEPHEIRVKLVRDGLIIEVILTEYDGYEIDFITKNSKIHLDDMFDVEEEE